MSDRAPDEQARADLLGRMLRLLRDDAGLNRPDFVRAMSAYPGGDVRADYINKLERGDRSLANASLEVREAIRLVLGVEPDDWQTLTGLFVPDAAPHPARARNVLPVYDSLGLPRPEKLAGNVNGAQYVDRTEWIDVPVRGLSAAGVAFYSESNRVGVVQLRSTEYDPQHEVVRVVGDSMAPTLKDGDHVAIDPHDLTLAEGRVYVFHILGDGHTLKRVRRLADGHLWMVSDNPAYPPMRPEEVEVRGRAVKRYPQTENL